MTIITVGLVLGLGDYLIVYLRYAADYVGPLDISLLKGHYHQISHLGDKIMTPAAASRGIDNPGPEDSRGVGLVSLSLGGLP